MTDELKEYLKDLDGIVEATSCEAHYLWRDYHYDKEVDLSHLSSVKFPWIEARSGYLPTIGHLDDRPIVISVLVNTINNKRILFWHATSQVVDYIIIDKWLDENFPEVKKTDAMNFCNILR